jgi:hypothetical protein
MVGVCLGLTVAKTKKKIAANAALTINDVVVCFNLLERPFMPFAFIYHRH